MENIAKDLLVEKGHVKAEVLLNYAHYIERKEGKEGLKRVEDRMAELGASVSLGGSRNVQWMRVGINSLLLLVCKEQFQWTEKDIRDMGYVTSKISFITRMLVRFFVSREKVLKEANRHWRKYFDFGSLEAVDHGDNYAVIEIKGYKGHPLNCHLFAGYIHGISELISKDNKNITVEEIKCIHKGDDGHRFKTTWN